MCISEILALIGYDCNGGEGIGAEGQSSDSNAAPAVCDDAEPQTCADLLMTQDPISCGQAILANNAGGIPVDDAIFETEVKINTSKITLFLYEIVFGLNWSRIC